METFVLLNRLLYRSPHTSQIEAGIAGEEHPKVISHDQAT